MDQRQAVAVDSAEFLAQKKPAMTHDLSFKPLSTGKFVMHEDVNKIVHKAV